MEKKLKRPYSKPQIKQINLVAEEAVLLGCKTSADPSGKVAGPNNCGNRNDFCSTATS
jgi:hypothetical protein